MNIELLVTLWAGHYLADFPLQPAFVAELKSKVFVESIGFHCLTAHAMIHGLVAGMITQNFGAGLFVGVTHWLIDAGKARFKFYGINIDQALHFLMILLVSWRVS